MLLLLSTSILLCPHSRGNSSTFAPPTRTAIGVSPSHCRNRQSPTFLMRDFQPFQHFSHSQLLHTISISFGLDLFQPLNPIRFIKMRPDQAIHTARPLFARRFEPTFFFDDISVSVGDLEIFFDDVGENILLRPKRQRLTVRIYSIEGITTRSLPRILSSETFGRQQSDIRFSSRLFMIGIQSSPPSLRVESRPSDH